MQTGGYCHDVDAKRTPMIPTNMSYSTMQTDGLHLSHMARSSATSRVVLTESSLSVYLKRSTNDNQVDSSLRMAKVARNFVLC